MKDYNMSNISFYKIIKHFIKTFDRSPSFDEIKEITGLGSNVSVRYHLNILEEKGLIDFHTETTTTLKIELKENLYE